MMCDADVADDVLGLTWHLEKLSACSTWHDYKRMTATYQEHESTCGAFATDKNLGGT